MKPKKKKEKKPDYRKTETFQDYKSAAATFSDYNPGTDTVFVGASIDPGMADRKAQHQANVSASKGASNANYNDTKMYRTKNEAGQDVYVSLRKYDKNEYSKGGKMKAKKYKKGGPLSFEDKANKGNDAAKALETGKTKDGFPLTAAMRKKLEKIAKENKNIQLMSPAPFEDDGMRKKGGKMPSYKKGGKVTTTKSKKEEFEKRVLKFGGEKPKGFKEKPKKFREPTSLEDRQAERNAQMLNRSRNKYKKGGKMMKYLKGGQVKLDANKDGKITGQDFKMLKKK